MILATLLPLLSAWLLGVLVVILLWPRRCWWRSEACMILPLGLGIGLGVTSVLFFAASLISAEPARVSAGLELVVGVALACGCWRRSRVTVATPLAESRGISWLGLILGSLALQLGVIAIVVSVRAYGAEPFGSWDGWAIWNMHARFIFRGGAAWTGLLREAPLAWTHADYPLLVPASVARGWAYAGRDAPAVSGFVSAMFGVATLGVFVGAISQLRSRTVAFAGGIVLLGTPFFVTFASNEHADIPLGFFILATLALLALGQREPAARGLPALAGLTAGLAAWTKNEGLLFAIVATVVSGFGEFRRGSLRNIAVFFGGLIVALLPVAYFKIALAPPNDLITAGLGERLGYLFDGARHRLILASLWRDLARFGEWRIAPFLALALPLLGPGWRRLHAREWLVAAALALMFAGYYVVYLLTPWDLAWHLDTSLVRLLLQLWPAAIFFWCLAVTFDEGAAVSRRPVAIVALVLINVAIAAGTLTAMGNQLAANELAAVRVDSARVSAVVGEGWFDRETAGRDNWMWSRGDSASTLLLHVAGEKPATPLALRFEMRGLGSRNVTAKIGDRVIWSGHVGERLAHFEITGLTPPPGGATIVFTTDVPGVPESAGPGARALTFALYNVRLAP